MAKASINFQKTKHNSVAETTREFEAHYLLPKEHRKQNEFWSCGKSDSQVFEAELQKATRKGGRVPKEENSLWEAVLNLNANHNLEDVQRVAKLIEEKFNITCSRIAVHKDEGHINERGIVEYNLHAHINFVTYKDGKQNWRREHITPQNLSQLQTDIAQTLNMTRGKEGSEAVRLGHRQQRVIAKEREAKEDKIFSLKTENEALKYDFREFQKRITGLETENTDLKKELHRLNTQVNKGNATIQELEKRLQEALQSKKAPETIKDTPKEIKSDFRPIYAPKIEYKTVEVKKGMFGSEKEVVLSNVHAMQLESYAEALAEQNKSLKRQNAELKGQNEALQEINGYQEAEIKKLSPYKQAYNDLMAQLRAITKIDKLENIINAIKAKFSHTQEAKREEKPKTIFEQNMELVKEQTPELNRNGLSDREFYMQLADQVQREAKKPTETVKAFNEEQKSKPSRSWQR